jgi:hypothetical protein
VETFDGREIHLIVYPEPLEVAYESVFELIPRLKEKYPNVAYFVHLGVHQKAEKFRVERRARKSPYERKDVRGCSFDGPDDDGKWSILPQELFTGVDVPALVEMVKADVKVRCSTTVTIRFLLICGYRPIILKYRMMLASFSASSSITIRWCRRICHAATKRKPSIRSSSMSQLGSPRIISSKDEIFC